MKLHKDHIKFLVFLGIVIVLTSFLMDIITRSWNTSLMKDISGVIRSIDPAGISVFMSITIGFYIGSTLLLIIDRYKRIQAIILSIGIFIVMSQMSDTFNVDWNIIYIGLGVVIGIFLGGGFEFKKNKQRNDFKKAAKNVSYASVIYIIMSFLILYMSQEDSSNFIKDSIVIMAFSYFFGEIMSITVKGPKIFILGPGKSGKTLFLAGCYMRVLNITEIPVKPSEYLVDLIAEMHQEGIEWPGQTLGTIKEYQFTYETGKIFPKETTLRTIDYPGPFIEKIAEYMDIKSVKGATLSEDEIKYATVAQEVSKADKLIFVIDGGRYPNFGDMGLLHYIKIITKLHDKGRDIEPYIVVTKSDLFISQYPNYEADYKGFKQFIEDKFSQNINLKMLLNEATNASFYPVFYYTKNVSNAPVPIPIRDENRNVYTFGFDKFMNHLMETE